MGSFSSFTLLFHKVSKINSKSKKTLERKRKKKNVPVCRCYFMKVFSISKARINLIAKTIHEGKIPQECRGGDRKSRQSAHKKDQG